MSRRLLEDTGALIVPAKLDAEPVAHESRHELRSLERTTAKYLVLLKQEDGQRTSPRHEH